MYLIVWLDGGVGYSYVRESCGVRLYFGLRKDYLSILGCRIMVLFFEDNFVIIHEGDPHLHIMSGERTEVVVL